MIRSSGTKAMALLTPALPPTPLRPPLMVRLVSTPQTSITMVIWISFPLRPLMIKSPGTKTMALLTQALPPAPLLRPLIRRILSTLRMLITMAIWMSFPPLKTMIKLPGTKTMAPQIPVLPPARLRRPLMERILSTLRMLITMAT